MYKRLLAAFLVVVLWIPGLVMAEAEPLTVSPALKEEVERFVSAELAKLAEETEDGWQRFICEQGVGEVTLTFPKKFDLAEGGTISVTFYVVGAQPKLKTQPTYDKENPKGWLKGIADAMLLKDTSIKTSIVITPESDGSYAAEFAAKAEAALVKSVKGVADKAKKAFTAKTFLPAIRDYFAPSPIATPKKAPDAISKDEYTQAFKNYLKNNELDLKADPAIPGQLYGLKGYKLDVSGGPAALVLGYTLPDDGGELVFDIIRDVVRELHYDKKAKTRTDEELTDMIIADFNEKMIEFTHSKAKDGGEEGSLTFNLFSLAEQVTPEAMFPEGPLFTDTSLAIVMPLVKTGIDRIPDYPAVPDPKPGVVFGSNKGTTCNFKIPNDGYNRCVQVIDADSGEVHTVAFLGNGRTVKVRIPQGKYYFVIGGGDIWYGPEHLFGEDGSYVKSGQIMEIASTRYYHTYTLNPKKESKNTVPLDQMSYDDLF